MPRTAEGRTRRHGRESFFIEGEGVVGPEDSAAGPPVSARANTTAASGPALAAAPAFRFSRLGPPGVRLPETTLRKVALAMTGGSDVDGTIPAGFTYLGQFVDHDLTFDATTVAFGDNVSPAALLQGRSPTLDLDSLYGAGPLDEVSAAFYEADRTRLKVGRTTRIGGDQARVGFDVPRVGTGSESEKLLAAIPDRRNDENLVVAQTHAAMIRFHNRVVAGLGPATPPADRFEKARRKVVLHYQWMLRTDYLARICDGDVVTDVFTNGRKVVDPGADPLSMPTMPVEFSVAAFRLGHAMIREAYDWNAASPPAPGASTCSSSSPARAVASGVAPRCRRTGSPTGAASTASRRSDATTSSRRRGSSTWPAASTPGSSTRSRLCPPGRSEDPRPTRAPSAPTWPSAT